MAKWGGSGCRDCAEVGLDVGKSEHNECFFLVFGWFFRVFVDFFVVFDGFSWFLTGFGE